jgi:hypothetical protein
MVVVARGSDVCAGASPSPGIYDGYNIGKDDIASNRVFPRVELAMIIDTKLFLLHYVSGAHREARLEDDLGLVVSGIWHGLVEHPTDTWGGHAQD